MESATEVCLYWSEVESLLCLVSFLYSVSDIVNFFFAKKRMLEQRQNKFVEEELQDYTNQIQVHIMSSDTQGITIVE